MDGPLGVVVNCAGQRRFHTRVFAVSAAEKQTKGVSVMAAPYFNRDGRLPHADSPAPVHARLQLHLYAFVSAGCADDVVLCDVAEVASGATGKAMGGVRQQFSTAAEVRLAQASIAFFRELGAPFFFQVGYLFLATTEEGLSRLRERAELQRALGVPVEDVDAADVDGLRADDVLGAVICREDGVASPAATARELVRRAAGRGVEVREHTDARAVDGDLLVVACGPRSGELFGELPIRPLVRQLVDVGPVEGLPQTLPMIVEEETTFHFRRRDSFLRLALREPAPRWSRDEV